MLNVEGGRGRGRTKMAERPAPDRGEADRIGRDSPSRLRPGRGLVLLAGRGTLGTLLRYTRFPRPGQPGRGLAPLLAAGRASGRLESGKQVFRHPASPGSCFHVSLAVAGGGEVGEFFHVQDAPRSAPSGRRDLAGIVSCKSGLYITGTPHVCPAVTFALQDVDEPRHG